MKDLAQKIREARVALGLNQAEFAEAISASQGSVSKWETGKEKPNAAAMVNVVRLTKRPMDWFWSSSDEPESAEDVDIAYCTPVIVGAIEAIFADVVSWEVSERQKFSIPLPNNLKLSKVEAWIVIGNRADTHFNNGDVVFTTPPSEYKPPLQDGDIVVLQRTDQKGRVEVSLRRYKFDGTGWLWTVTTDPTYQTPVTLRSEQKGDFNHKVLGVVISSYKLHHAAFVLSEWNRR